MRTSDDGSCAPADRPLKVFMVAGEHSGDALGAGLIGAMRQQTRRPLILSGVGGAEMAEQGLTSLYPISDVAVMGVFAIMPRLPRLIARVHHAADVAIEMQPDVVVIIDAPEFTHPIARRIRKRSPSIPIVDYVSPSVWAWRPGRAKAMRGYIDHVLALLPFEPAAHERLGGPRCTYIGHPLAEKLDWIASLDGADFRRRVGLGDREPVLVVLPGSRRSEITKLGDTFGEVIASLRKQGHQFRLVIPVADGVRTLVEDATAKWNERPLFVSSEADKYLSFKIATAALAASGTVTLQLALAQTPMVVAYRVDRFLGPIYRRLISAQSAVLANLVLGENAFPEFIQEDCTRTNLVRALEPLLSNTRERAAQMSALKRVSEMIRPPSPSPSATAAAIVLDYADTKRSMA